MSDAAGAHDATPKPAAETPAGEQSKPAPKKQVEPPREFLVSSAPHLADASSTRKIMFEVVLAMLPMFCIGVWMFRGQAVVLTIATIAGCLIAEAVANRIRGMSMESLGDGSAIVTGMILAFSLPPSLNPYMAFIGGVVAIALAKAVFGGLGQNLFNPAMVGRAFLMICFPAAMVTWTPTAPMRADLEAQGVDAVTCATPLYQAAKYAENVKKAAAEPNEAKAAEFREAANNIRSEMPTQWQLFIGNVGGCVGETSALAALIGGLFLVLRGTADWRQPLGCLLAVTIFALIAHMVNPDAYETPVYHLTSGSLMFGAFFIATDYVGAPITPKGRIIFGVGFGVLVMVIRMFGAYPEGVMFAILIMNALTPLIERWTVPTPFGGHVAKA